MRVKAGDGIVKQTKQFDLFITYIKDSPLFSGMDFDNIERFFSEIEYVILDMEKGESIPHEILECVFVIKGRISTFENTVSGQKKFLNSFNDKDNSCIMITKKDIYSSISLEAMEHSVVILIKQEAFTTPIPSIIIEQNIFEQNMIKSWIKVTEFVTNRSMIISEPNSRIKIIKFLLLQRELQHSDTLKISLSREDLASYMKVDTSTLMRELKILKKDGYIDYSGKMFILYDKINELIL